MEDVLSLLKSCTEPWLSFSSEYLGAVPSFILLNVVGLLLFYLCYLLLPTKHLDKAKRRKKGGTFRGWRSHRRETEEKRKLFSVLKRSLDHHQDSTHFRHMLCPDPSCEVCNRTTAEIQQLLSQESLQDAALSECFSSSADSIIETSVCLSSDLSTIPPGDATAFPMPEPSPPPCSTLSTNLDISCEDFISPSNLGDSLPPELTPYLDFSFPGDHFPSQPLALPPPPPPSSQETDPVFQGDITVTLGDSLGLVSTHRTKTKSIHSPNTTSEVWHQAHTKDLSTSNLAQGDAKQDVSSLPSSKASTVDDPEVNLLSSLLFLSPDALALLERQVKKRSELLIHKEKETKTESFPKQYRPDQPPHSSGKLLKCIPGKHDLVVSFPFWSSKDKSHDLIMIQQPLPPKPFEVCLQKKCIQLTWGHSALHHDLLYPAGLVSSSCSSSNFVVFSSIHSTCTAQEVPILPDSPSLSETQIQIQSLPQNMPQPQPQIPLDDQPQSSLPNLQPSPLPQDNTCGVHFLGFPNEEESLMPSEIQGLEHHLLKKKQESFWDIPSVVLMSQKDFCPPAPKISLGSQFPKAHKPISILPGDFALHSEIRQKLEHHLRKRLIQYRWGLPRRVHESLSLINPQTDATELCESEGNQGHSGFCLFKHQSSKRVLDVGLGDPGDFCETASKVLPLEKDEETGSRDHLASGSERISDMGGWSDSEEHPEFHMVSLLENHFGTSGISVNQKQLEDALKAHLNRKVMQINDSQIPVRVCNSWCSMKQPLPLPEKLYGKGEHSDLTPLVRIDGGINTACEISFLCSSKKAALEDHIKSFHKRIMWGLPKKILESIEIFNSKENPFECSCHSSFLSSINFASKVDSQGSVSKSFRGSSITLQQDNLGKTISGPSLDCSVPVVSLVCKERLETQMQTPCEISQERVGNIQEFNSSRQHFLPCTDDTIDKAKQKQPKSTHKSGQTLPPRQNGARPETRDKTGSSMKRTERLQGTKRQNSEHVPTYITYREIFKAKELCTPQSPCCPALTVNEPESPPVKGVISGEKRTTLTPIRPSPKIPETLDPKLSDLKNLLLCELKLKLAGREYGQAYSQPYDLALAIGNQKDKCVLTSPEGICPGHTTPSQVLCVHTDSTGISRQQMQEPCAPICGLWKDQDESFLPAAKRMNPPEPKPEELGGGDAGLGSSRSRRRSHAVQDEMPKDMCGKKSSPVQSQREQLPAESHFRKRVKHFLQWIWPSGKCDGKNSFLEQASSPPSVQSMGLSSNQVAFTGNAEAQVKTPGGKIPGHKLGHGHETDETCHQELLSTQANFSKTQHKAELQIGAVPVQGCPFNHGATSCKATSTTFCCQ